VRASPFGGWGANQHIKWLFPVELPLLDWVEADVRVVEYYNFYAERVKGIL